MIGMTIDIPNAAYLKALTLDAQNALHGQKLEIGKFPFRIGRESRGPNASWKKDSGDDRRKDNTSPTNDLYLWEQSAEKHISREHCEIQKEGGEYFLFDRESALGTWVEGQLVGGGRRWGRVPLTNGDVIIVGPYTCGFIFKFTIEPKTLVIEAGIGSQTADELPTNRSP